MYLPILIAFSAKETAISCPSDHYAFGNICVKCEDSMQWCISCHGPGKCTECRAGYYLDFGYCKPCDHTCRTCNNPNSCLECSANHCRSPQGVCDEPEEVYSGCNKCAHDTNKCIKCNAGYFFDPKTFTCNSCKDNCQTCKNESTCETPSSGYYLDKQTGEITMCTDLNCQTCNTSKDVCDECIDGYTTVGATNGGCVKCTNRYCAICKDKDTCVTCKKGYVLNGKTCLPCATNCEFCMNGASPAPRQCVTGGCETGYWFNSSTNFCVKCPEGCEICHYDSVRAETVCDKCKVTTNAIAGPSIYGVLCTKAAQVTCADNEFQENGACIRCETSIMGCEACSERYNCTRCQSTFYLSGNICVGCDSTCNECEGTGSNCKSCNSTSALRGNTCVPVGEVIPNCIEATSTVSENTCISCAPGYYISNGSCARCADQCESCNGPTLDKCITAIEGYRFNRTSNVLEKCQVENCGRCLANANECTTCRNGYYLASDNKACTRGSIENCAKYAKGMDKCSACVDGYGFSEGADPSCIPCQKECVGDCYFANICVSGACADGFYFNQKDNKCAACPSGCSMCKWFWTTNSFGCTRCTSGETVSLSTNYGLRCSNTVNKSRLSPGMVSVIVILVLLLIGVCAAMPFIVKALVRKGIRRRSRAMKFDRGSADNLLLEGSADSAI